MKKIVNLYKILHSIICNYCAQCRGKRVREADPGNSRGGEEWARFSNLTDGIVCMINAKFGLAFIREKYNYWRYLFERI